MGRGESAVRINLVVCAVLALVTVAVYAQVYNHKYLNYDDIDISDNPELAGGLTPGNLQKAFTSTLNANWFPVTRLSWLVDWQLFHRWDEGKDWPGGHILENVVQHTLSGLILFLTLAWMTGRRWLSAAVAGLFLLHPLHVESVAWAIERKDTLSGLFWMLTLAAYAGYVRRSGIARYLLIVLALALGLMAKPMLVTLPLALLLLDWWPLGRLRGGPAPALLETATSREPKPAGNSPKKKHNQPPQAGAGKDRRAPWPTFSAGFLILEKAPLLAMVLASAIVTFTVQAGAGAITGGDHLPPAERMANALMSYVMYIYHMLIPAKLAIIYTFQRMPPATYAAYALGAAVLLLGVSALAITLARRRPYALVGWFWYLGTLVPVIGIIQVGTQSMADRYTYLPLIGLFILVVWAAADVATWWPMPSWVLGAAGAAVLVACAAATFVELGYWKDSVTLFEHAIASTGDNWVAEDNLGLALANDPDKPRPDKALDHYRRAIALKNGRFMEASFDLSCALMDIVPPRADEAIDVCTQGLKGMHEEERVQLKPGYLGFYVNLARAWDAKKRPDLAIENYQKAIALYREGRGLEVQGGSAYSYLGVILANQGKFDEALENHREAVRLKPNDAAPHNNMAVGLATYAAALAAGGKAKESDEQLRLAIDQYRRALEINPKYAEAHHNLAAGLIQIGQTDEGLREYRMAVELKPDYADARFHLAMTLTQCGREAEAVTEYRKALELRKDWPDVLVRLARLLATSADAGVRNGPDAVRLAQEANTLTGGQAPVCLDVLAEAYAEAGQFPEAAATVKQAIAISRSVGNQQDAAVLEDRLKLYEANRPFHLAPAKP
jgi:tetratricopeptide (TPR) repeat protein